MKDLEDITKTFIAFDEPDYFVFELLFEDNKKSLKRLHKLVSSNLHYFAFQYIKYCFATIGQMTSQSFIRTVVSSVGSKRTPVEIANLAIDIALTNKAFHLLDKAHYPTSKLEILRPESIHKDPLKVAAQISDDFNDLVRTKIPSYIRKLRLIPQADKITTSEKQALHKPGEGTHGYQQLASKESVLVDLSTQLYATISTSCKGTDVGNLFAAEFESIQVSATWFEDLARSLEAKIIQKSHEGYSSWSNLSKTKRHLYPSPIRISSDKKITAYVTIDVSSSVSTQDLQKILGVFEQYSHLISKLVIMQHTAAVLQQFELIDSYGDLSDHPEWTDALGTRHGDGGTSHIDCFYRIDKHINKNNIDPKDVLLLSFSDNYSDIEDTFFKYPSIKELDAYWIRDSHGRDVNTNLVGGQNIIMP